MNFGILKGIIQELEREGVSDEATVAAMNDNDPVPLCVYAISYENHQDDSNAQIVWIKVAEL